MARGAGEILPALIPAHCPPLAHKSGEGCGRECHRESACGAAAGERFIPSAADNDSCVALTAPCVRLLLVLGSSSCVVLVCGTNCFTKVAACVVFLGGLC